ncbi:restriction endonuclease [Acetobacteraceae bacterium]|nr:restriction endonuclease [Candidatus Parcubacteria bacterium]
MSLVVSKADGTVESFEPEKLVSSLKRAGASTDVAQDIARDLEKSLWSGISTQEIYGRAFARLREHRRGVAARYSLKRAVLDFGPSGFPFESYIAELFRAEGYPAEVDKIIQGKCVDHEVDVVVHQKDAKTYVEAKFHNNLGFRTDLKVVLYVQARIEDIAQANELARGLVVTNTKFTSKAIQYASCHGLELLAWDYPHHGTLHERIDKAALYPITALTTLSHHEKRALLEDRIVLCNALSSRTEVLQNIGVTGAKATGVLEEVGALCMPEGRV